MKPAPFDYHAPATVEEALALLAQFGDDAKVLAGGQSLIPLLALRLTRFDALVDLGRIEALRGIERDNGAVVIGAMTPQADVERSDVVASDAPLVAQATPLIGHFQIRNRGTLGGSIAHADPAAEYPAVAAALDAELDVTGPDGTRRIAASDFFVSTFMTNLEATEVVTAVRFPTWGGQSGFAVEELARRHGDFALAGVACGVQLDGGAISRAAIGLFGMGSTPLRAEAAEKALLGAGAADIDGEEIGRLAVADLDPPDDVHASKAYRSSVGGVLVARALKRALEEAGRG